MDFIAQLLQEHTRVNTDLIVKAVGNNKANFKQIIDIVYHQPPPLPQRASWVIPNVNKLHPELLTPYIAKFIDTLQTFNVDAVKRNMMVVLASHSIPEKLQGKLVNVCFDLMLSSSEMVVVKVHAMQALANMAQLHPELKTELKTVIQELAPNNTAAFKARARHVLKKLG